ncbi:MFS general substrate transporter [Daldinia decipiens]|uniref:MFS general substrate transporter n=1 Tax=Daldinia decipiens TaxID=326647 RepID=UPI0020C301D4|nr:MFS general substrate transporter [Daldinia decipiens]KAI1660295.1 MFS general substrate transporter [Daldinia decipiens]
MALDMPSDGYNTALWIFYIPFVLAEVSANLILNLNTIRPGIGGQVFLLGVLGVCQGLARSYDGLLTVRFLLGVFESSLPASATYMISMYYTRPEVAVRFAWFFNSLRMRNLGFYQLRSAIISYIFLEASRGAEAKGSAADSVPICKVLVDWRICILTLCFFCANVKASSIASFSPTIFIELGWTATTVQLMMMPVWVTGSVSTFAITWLASRLDMRMSFLLICICLQAIGWSIMVAYVPEAGVRYLALFFMAAGTFPQMSILMGWLSANLRGRKYLAVGMAWMSGFANCANFISSNVFITTERPRYPTGFSIGLAFTILGFILTCAAFVLLILSNKRRDKTREQMTDDQCQNDDKLHFQYLY